MPREPDRQKEVLIVSGSEQFDMIIRNILSQKACFSVDRCRNASAARRCILKKRYDIIIINCPLQDEFGHELALDVAESGNASILTAVPMEVYDAVVDNMTDYGIFALGKPVSKEQAERKLRFIEATQNRIWKVEKKLIRTEEKMEELHLVGRAKLLLMEKKHISEDEAHRLIGKQAMDHGLSRRRIAEMILDDF